MPSKIHRVLGIDPGIARCGWAIVEQTNGRVRLVASGCLTTPAGAQEQRRLAALHRAITDVIRKYQPQRAAMERLFFTTNVSTAMTVGQARGVVLLALGQASLDVIELPPTTIKQAATGYGRADKKQIQRMMKTLLRLPRVPSSDDEADAMAVAFCAATMRSID